MVGLSTLGCGSEELCRVGTKPLLPIRPGGRRRRVTGRAALDFDSLAPRRGPGGAAGAAQDGAGDTPRRSGLVDAIGRALLDRPLAAQQRRTIEALLTDSALRADPDLSPTARRRRRVRAAVHMVLTTPEFALA